MPTTYLRDSFALYLHVDRGSPATKIHMGRVPAILHTPLMVRLGCVCVGVLWWSVRCGRCSMLATPPGTGDRLSFGVLLGAGNCGPARLWGQRIAGRCFKSATRMPYNRLEDKEVVMDTQSDYRSGLFVGPAVYLRLEKRNMASPKTARSRIVGGRGGHGAGGSRSPFSRGWSE